MNETELHYWFSDFLIQRLGYPSEAVLHEYPLPQRDTISAARADLLIQDAARSRLSAIVEMKTRYSPDTVAMGFAQLGHYLEILGRQLPAYLVVADNTASHKFRVFTQDSEKQVLELDPLKFPSYAALVSGDVTVESERIEKESKEKTDAVRTICILAASILIILLVLSMSGVFSPTPTQLGLIGAIIGLFLLPNAAKLKGLGIEFERLKNEK